MPFSLASLPASPKDRFEVYRIFNGMSEEGKAGLDSAKTRVPLVKTFLLEHVSDRGTQRVKPLGEIWKRHAAILAPIDESFHSVTDFAEDPDTKKQRQVVTGYIEQYSPRFFAYYTVEGSQEAKRRVRNWIGTSPDLDASWFSSPLLKHLWDKDIVHRGDHRFGKLVFRHESVFEMPEDSADTPGEDQEDEADDGGPEPERRKFRSEMGDSVGRLRKSLDGLRRSYPPLHALYSVRIPSMAGRGGHDLFQDGQITNRSDSFEDHRNHARYLWRLYDGVLSETEECAWGDPAAKEKPVGWNGVPLIVRFDEALSQTTFDNWVTKAFQKRNVFKLWGDPLRLGPTKIHVYGADRHLWQPINLEMTERQLVAILPRGTCGNTFHRLVANIQRYISPKIDAWIGSRSLESFLSDRHTHDFSDETR
ncbi:MAG: hypothetical protein J0M04_12130 [Verrucomicrobia bacterium]|nr:hypothetical protein [Verrucomicrobiota bacterium]